MRAELRRALCSLIVISAIPIFASAQTIASKIEEQGYAKFVKVVSLMAKQRDGFLRVQVSLQNTDNEARQLYWRVKWLDEDGFQVWEDEAWKPILVHGSSRQELNSVAPTAKAKDFRIQLNAADNTANKPDAFQHSSPSSTN